MNNIDQLQDRAFTHSHSKEDIPFILRIYKKLQGNTRNITVTMTTDIEKRIRAEVNKSKHMTLSREQIGDRRIFVIGDIHGCLDELQELLLVARVDTQNDVVISVGDILNKGPKPVECLHLMRSFPHMYMVRGNHEHMIVRMGTCSGGLTGDDMSYLRDIPFTVTIPHLNVIVVHAGLIPGVPLTEQKTNDLIWMRNIIQYDDGSMEGYMESDQGVQWGSLWPGPEHVYFGHAARYGLQKHQFATGLDTGCVKGRKLTGMYITGSKEIFSVPAKQKYDKS